MARQSRRLIMDVCVLALAVSSMASSVCAARPTEGILHSFGGGDGAYPSSLTSGPDGMLIGSTFAGGQTGGGTVFQLRDPSDDDGPWALQTLHVFGPPLGDADDGTGPVGDLVRGASGALYGVTITGGSSEPGGTVYRLDPSANPMAAWHETILYRFTEAGGAIDGDHPQAGLVLASDGSLYGTTWAGGQFGAGTVFRLAPPPAGQTAWTELVLHSFSNGGDGGYPASTLLPDGTGGFFGTATTGGLTCCNGVVFRLSPPAAGGSAWTERIVYGFTGALDGSRPNGRLAVDPSGSLYGTTTAGGVDYLILGGRGVAYKLTAPVDSGDAWTETVLHSFHNGFDGRGPAGGLSIDNHGFLYGATVAGGGAYDAGTLFRLDPPDRARDEWRFAVLHAFGADPVTPPHDGANPAAPPVVFEVPRGSPLLFGITGAGGAFNEGEVFETAP